MWVMGIVERKSNNVGAIVYIYIYMRERERERESGEREKEGTAQFIAKVNS